MNKGEIVNALYAKHEAQVASKAEMGRIVDDFLDLIVSEVKVGNGVQIAGFGNWNIAERAAREGKNPQTGEKMKIEACTVCKFKPGKALKEAAAAAPKK